MARYQIFDDGQIASLRRGGEILRACLRHTGDAVRPGMTTAELDRIAEEFIRSHGGEPAFKGYRGFPGTLCTSVNEQCVHGIPGSRVLKDGDILSLDGGVLLDGLYTDACITVPVGEISPDAARLLQVTEQALKEAVKTVHEGVRIGTISATVQRVVEDAGYHPLHALTGHGLGTTLHQFPDIPNYGEAGTGSRVPARTILAIEPIVSIGTERVKEEDDDWTISTRDGSLSAHFEHTVLVTRDGCEILA